MLLCPAQSPLQQASLKLCQQNQWDVMQLHRSSHLCTDQQQLVILKDPAEDFHLNYRGIQVNNHIQARQDPLLDTGTEHWT